MAKRLKASELVAILQQRIKEFGDLEIIVSTQDGGAYGLYGADEVSLVVGKNKNGKLIEKLEIG